MHFDMSKLNWLRTDWFAHVTNAHLRHVTPIELRDINSHIDQFFDAHVRITHERVSVPINCPGHWPAVLAPVWIACGRNDEEAAMFLGNLYCRRAIARPEVWLSFNYAVIPWHPRLYVRAQDNWNWPGRKRPK